MRRCVHVSSTDWWLDCQGIEGSGTFAFIPDAGFVGTVFVNAMSNLLVTMAKDLHTKRAMGSTS